MPRAVSLYGTLPEQLARPDSFVAQLRHILAVRRRYRLAAATQLEILPLASPALLAMVHRLGGDDPAGADPNGADPDGADPDGADPDGADPNGEPGLGGIQVTVLNFGQIPTSETLGSSWFPPGGAVVDLSTGEELTRVDHAGRFTVTLAGHQGLPLSVG